MSRFPSAAHLSSWAGMCPGNHESAGKRRSGKTRRGNRWIRTALVEAGGAAGRTKRTALGARYRRLRGHVGHGRGLKGGPQFDYPIDYSVAVTRVDRASELIEFIAKWAPNAYCHYHRHLGPTSSWVVQGEHHIVETTEMQTIHKTRRPGFRGKSPAGEIHMEYGGAEGSTVLFLCEAIDGKLFDIVASDGTVLATATLDDFASGRLAR